MKNAILPALFGLAAMAAAPAMATTVFDFTTGSPAGSGNSNSDLSSYSVTAGGVTATAYAFYATGTQSAPTGNLIGPTSTNAPVVGEYNGDGVGVCQTSGGSATNCSSPFHQISDGNNGSGSTYDYEFVLIAFNAAVNLSQIQLGNFGNNSLGGDPFGVTYYTSSTTSSLSSIETGLEATTVGGDASFTSKSAPTCLTGDAALGGGASGGGSYTDNCSVNGNGIESLTGSGVTYLLIGASLSGQGDDYFKLQDISAALVSTPEPATFGMLGIAFGGMGLIFRKRRSI